MAMSFLRAALRVAPTAAPTSVRAMSTSPLSEIDVSFTPKIDFTEPSNPELEVTTTSNGVTVVTESNNSPTSKITVVVAAGSRNEGVENAGVSHVMRELAFLSANDRSSLAMKRYNDAVGADVTCTSDREVISYSANFLKKDLDTVMGNLSAATTNQAFKSWEVNDKKAHIADFLGTLPSKPLVMDALHAGAFRTTLGNSTTVAPYKLGDIDVDTITEYYENFFTAGNMTVVGAGVDHEELVQMVEQNFSHVEAKDVPAVTASYFGGYESRVASGTGNADVAVAFEGVGRGAPDQVASMVLEQLVGGEAKVKYGGVSGAQAVKSATSSIETFNMNYNDSGLFGIYVQADGEATGATVTDAVTAIKKVLGGEFTDADVTRAKNQLMTSVLDLSPAERADFYGSQTLATKQPLTPEEFADKVEAISTADIKAVATKIGASKAVLSSAGNVAYVPYASDLGL